MSRGTLTAGFVTTALLAAAPSGGVDPHLDRSLLPSGCPACHQGHGAPRSPMLPTPQVELCLSCHDSQTAAERRIRDGALALEARPRSVASSLSQPYVHPLSRDAYSSREGNAVTCTSCHSPHRSGSAQATKVPAGQRRLSSRDMGRYEFQLCLECHGSTIDGARGLLDPTRLTNPSNRSYHPVEAPAASRSPSLVPEWRGKEINCSDCHGNSDPAGARGPHGSAVRYLLAREYVTVDGSEESTSAYALCYRCHDRDAVLDGGAFSHRLHVVEERASCATCHSAHGSLRNRSLIRFGEETFLIGVAPSIRAGRLDFVSSGPGSGLCYVTCHGEDHAPASYGGAVAAPEALRREVLGESVPTVPPRRRRAGPKPKRSKPPPS